MSGQYDAAAEGTLGRPAHTERGEHEAESVLSLASGAGPAQSKEDCMAPPARFDDSSRNAAYWARVRRIVDQAPPLADGQRARIRAAFHQPSAQVRGAA
jgi:hypothetical protein